MANTITDPEIPWREKLGLIVELAEPGATEAEFRSDPVTTGQVRLDTKLRVRTGPTEIGGGTFHTDYPWGTGATQEAAVESLWSWLRLEETTGPLGTTYYDVFRDEEHRRLPNHHIRRFFKFDRVSKTWKPNGSQVYPVRMIRGVPEVIA